jgi:Toprim domain/Domain of unknown function (DUF6371)
MTVTTDRFERVDFKAVAGAALSRSRHLLPGWFPAGRWRGREFLIGNLAGDLGESLSINADTGLWADFASGERGVDLLALYASIHRLPMMDAARELGSTLSVYAGESTAAPIGQTPSAEWLPMVPTPEDVTLPSDTLFAGYDQTHTYRNSDGRVLFYVRRKHATGTRGKVFAPLTFGVLDGVTGWHTRAPASPRPLYGLDALAARPEAPVIVTEGEKAADAAARLLPDHVAMAWYGGAQAVSRVAWAPLGGRQVVMWPDADEAGLGAAKAACEAIRTAGGHVRVVVPPTAVAVGWDLADAEAERWTTEDVSQYLVGYDSAPESAPSNRRTIRIVAGDLESTVDEAEAALMESGRGIYQRAGSIVSVGESKIIAADAHEVSGLRIFERGEHALLEDLTAAAKWEKFDGRTKEWVATDAPAKVVNVLRQRVGRWKLPVLTAVISAPTMRPDGSILNHPGYDSATGLLFDPRGTTFPKIPENPTRADAKGALGVLHELIATFPFVGDADRAVALSGMLTAAVRRSLPTAPLHGFTAPAPGSGKTMLADLASVMAIGREAGVIAQGSNQEELEKRLGAALLAGDPVIAIDNCEAPLGGEFLCQIFTSPIVKTRILGKSETPEIPANACVFATGNNLTLIGDMTRRALLCRLDPKTERPELRVFSTDPITTMKAHRGRYVAAALTILRAYHVAGRPKQRPPLGSFGDWSRWVRDALVWLGEADPVDTMEATRALDPKQQARAALISAWQNVIGGERVTVREVIKRATETQAGTYSEYRNADFREALLVVAGDGGAINSRRLGQWLLSNQGRITNGCQIAQAGILSGSMTWQLSAAEVIAAK